MSLIEALVASALLGIGVVVGLTAWDTASLTARSAVRQAWARCAVRSELDAVLAAPWSADGSGYGTPDARLVPVTVSPVTARASTGPGAEQLVTVRAVDPQTHQVLFQVSALKSFALQGSKQMDWTVVSDLSLGCPAP